MPVLGDVLPHQNLNFHVATHIFPKGIHCWSEDLVHSLYYLIQEVDLYLDLLNSLLFDWDEVTEWSRSLCIVALSSFIIHLENFV